MTSQPANWLVGMLELMIIIMKSSLGKTVPVLKKLATKKQFFIPGLKILAGYWKQSRAVCPIQKPFRCPVSCLLTLSKNAQASCLKIGRQKSLFSNHPRLWILRSELKTCSETCFLRTGCRGQGIGFSFSNIVLTHRDEWTDPLKVSVKETSQTLGTPSSVFVETSEQ